MTPRRRGCRERQLACRLRLTRRLGASQRAVVVVNPMEGRKGHDVSLIGRDRKVRPQRPHGRRPPPHHGVLVLVGWQQEVKLSFGNI